MKKYNIGIDLLRIFAMILIFGIHFSQKAAFFGNSLFQCGAGAVYIFFSLSGYLAFLSLDKTISAKEYWKKRCLRILPSYWLLLILIILWKMLIMNIPTDPYKIGFLRYFLGLQTVIPSDNFDYWNNMYGLWTMSCFIIFYLFAPLLKKWIFSIRRAILLLPVSMLLCKITQSSGRWVLAHLGESINIDKPDVLIGSSPMNNLYAFVIGIIAYYIVKDKKYHTGFILSAVLLAISQMIELSSLIWCVIALLVIVGSEVIAVNKQKVIIPIRFLSAYSFYIYLAHMFAFDIAENIAHRFCLGRGAYMMILFMILITLIVLMAGFDKFLLNVKGKLPARFGKGSGNFIRKR